MQRWRPWLRSERGDERAITAVSARLEDRDKYVRHAAVEAMAQIAEKGDAHAITARGLGIHSRRLSNPTATGPAIRRPQGQESATAPVARATRLMQQNGCLFRADFNKDSMGPIKRTRAAEETAEAMDVL